VVLVLGRGALFCCVGCTVCIWFLVVCCGFSYSFVVYGCLVVVVCGSDCTGWSSFNVGFGVG